MDVVFYFNGWLPVLRVLVIALTGYLTLVVLLRFTARRTLAQMSALDFVITVTIGSAFGRVLTARSVALAEVVTAFVALVVLQQVMAFAWRSPRLRRFVDVPPAVLFHDGQVMHAALRRHRLQEQDLLAAARRSGNGSMDDVHTVLLEGNGSLTVLTDARYGDGSTLDPVDGAGPDT